MTKSIPHPRVLSALVLLAGLLLFPLADLADPTGARIAAACRAFPETGKTVCDPFLAYWDAHGGLAQQGFPISGEMQERSDTDGRIYTVQYFERARFEMHPEKPAPYRVLLGLLGSARYLEYYGPAGAPNQRPSTANPRLFPETKRTVGGPFRAYWERHGGLMQQGFPISEEFTEISAIDGKPYTMQYFERAVFELHPENKGTPHEVLLSQLGAYEHRAKYIPLTIPGPSAPDLEQARIRVSDMYLLWHDGRYKQSDWPHDLPQFVPEAAFALELRTSTVKHITAGTNVLRYISSLSGPLAVGEGESTVPDCPRCDVNLLGLDLRSNQVFTLTDRIEAYHAPVISGRRVAWTEQRGNSISTHIKELDTGETLILPVSSSLLFLGPEYLTWVRYESDPKVCRYSLHVYDLMKRTSRDISHTMNGSCSVKTLTLSGRYLAVVEYWSQNSPPARIVDLLSGQTLFTMPHEPDAIAMRGDTLAWTSTNISDDVSKQYLWAVKLSKPAQPVLVASALGRPQPIIAGDWIVWKEFTVYPRAVMQAKSIYQAFANPLPVPPTPTPTATYTPTWTPGPTRPPMPTTIMPTPGPTGGVPRPVWSVTAPTPTR